MRNQWELENIKVTPENISEKAVLELDLMKRLMEADALSKRQTSAKLDALEKRLFQTEKSIANLELQNTEIIAQNKVLHQQNNHIINLLQNSEARSPSSSNTVNISAAISTSSSNGDITSRSLEFSSLSSALLPSSSSADSQAAKKARTINDVLKSSNVIEITAINSIISRSLLTLFIEYQKNPQGCLQGAKTGLSKSNFEKYKAQMARSHSMIPSSDRLRLKDIPDKQSEDYTTFCDSISKICTEAIRKEFEKYWPHHPSTSDHSKRNCNVTYSNITVNQMTEAHSGFSKSQSNKDNSSSSSTSHK